ncbi:hypothetical protein FIU88_00400 [Halomonas sp. THAF12]|uniref:glycine zipper domain-containing protein n=1 Tax=Halomonas sp. THAF12 TaxID=2587849 RepID=UPI0012A9FE03|nr:glycine zipper domain-containing protein [Halomonas sp. THAF12]QFT83424.1 hypothetical protein FIU88_00400 [Halomonas sp. THAF12]
MKMSFRPTFLIALLLASSILLSGCQSLSAQQRTALGTSIGSVAGALVGSTLGDGNGRMVAMALGAVVGGFVGNEFANYLNEKEQESLARSTQQALNANEDSAGSMSWSSQQRKGVDGEIYYGQAIAANDRQAGDSLAIVRGSELTSQEEAQLASLSSGTQCRATRTSLSVQDRDVADGAIWCRTPQGDYQPLDAMAA